LAKSEILSLPLERFMALVIYFDCLGCQVLSLLLNMFEVLLEVVYVVKFKVGLKRQNAI